EQAGLDGREFLDVPRGLVLDDDGLAMQGAVIRRAEEIRVRIKDGEDDLAVEFGGLAYLGGMLLAVHFELDLHQPTVVDRPAGGSLRAPDDIVQGLPRPLNGRSARD